MGDIYPDGIVPIKRDIHGTPLKQVKSSYKKIILVNPDSVYGKAMLRNQRKKQLEEAKRIEEAKSRGVFDLTDRKVSKKHAYPAAGVKITDSDIGYSHKQNIVNQFGLESKLNIGEYKNESGNPLKVETSLQQALEDAYAYNNDGSKTADASAGSAHIEMHGDDIVEKGEMYESKMQIEQNQKILLTSEQKAKVGPISDLKDLEEVKFEIDRVLKGIKKGTITNYVIPPGIPAESWTKKKGSAVADLTFWQNPENEFSLTEERLGSASDISEKQIKSVENLQKYQGDVNKVIADLYVKQNLENLEKLKLNKQSNIYKELKKEVKSQNTKELGIKYLKRRATHLKINPKTVTGEKVLITNEPTYREMQQGNYNESVKGEIVYDTFHAKERARMNIGGGKQGGLAEMHTEIIDDRSKNIGSNFADIGRIDGKDLRYKEQENVLKGFTGPNPADFEERVLGNIQWDKVKLRVTKIAAKEWSRTGFLMVTPQGSIVPYLDKLWQTESGKKIQSKRLMMSDKLINPEFIEKFQIDMPTIYEDVSIRKQIGQEKVARFNEGPLIRVKKSSEKTRTVETTLKSGKVHKQGIKVIDKILDAEVIYDKSPIENITVTKTKEITDVSRVLDRVQTKLKDIATTKKGDSYGLAMDKLPDNWKFAKSTALVSDIEETRGPSHTKGIKYKHTLDAKEGISTTDDISGKIYAVAPKKLIQPGAKYKYTLRDLMIKGHGVEAVLGGVGKGKAILPDYRGYVPQNWFIKPIIGNTAFQTHLHNINPLQKEPVKGMDIEKLKASGSADLIKSLAGTGPDEIINIAPLITKGYGKRFGITGGDVFQEIEMETIQIEKVKSGLEEELNKISSVNIQSGSRYKFSDKKVSSDFFVGKKSQELNKLRTGGQTGLVNRERIKEWKELKEGPSEFKPNPRKKYTSYPKWSNKHQSKVFRFNLEHSGGPEVIVLQEGVAAKSIREDFAEKGKPFDPTVGLKHPKNLRIYAEEKYPEIVKAGIFDEDKSRGKGLSIQEKILKKKGLGGDLTKASWVIKPQQETKALFSQPKLNLDEAKRVMTRMKKQIAWESYTASGTAKQLFSRDKRLTPKSSTMQLLQATSTSDFSKTIAKYHKIEGEDIGNKAQKNLKVNMSRDYKTLKMGTQGREALRDLSKAAGKRVISEYKKSVSPEEYKKSAPLIEEFKKAFKLALKSV